jgi:dihydrodipicolinate synthase/N-acetylneuraminate lyase
VNRAGFNVGNPRLPLVPASDKAAAEIDKIMSQYTIDLPV